MAAGGKQPYIWTLVSGQPPARPLAWLPRAKSRAPSPRGTPASIFNFTVQVTDSSNPALSPVQQDLSIQVSRVSLAITGVAAAGPAGTSARPGDTITVTVSVLNSGSPADSVVPNISLSARGTASADCGQPSPASGSLAAGAQQNFTFTCSGVTGSGTLSFSVGITAIDRASGSSISLSPATSNGVTILGLPPQIAVAATSNGSPYSSGAWTNHDVIVTFTCTPAIGEPIVKTVTVVSEGANQTVNSTCTDLAAQPGERRVQRHQYR